MKMQRWTNGMRYAMGTALVGLALQACETAPEPYEEYESPGVSGDSCDVGSDCISDFCIEGVCAGGCAWRQDDEAYVPDTGTCITESSPGYETCSGSCCQIVSVDYESCEARGVQCPNPMAWFVVGYCAPTGATGSGGSSGGDECSSDSSCSSGERCKDGQCVDVECTSDSHCGYCERCSDDVCRDCGEGPYGCYC